MQFYLNKTPLQSGFRRFFDPPWDPRAASRSSPKTQIEPVWAPRPPGSPPQGPGTPICTPKWGPIHSMHRKIDGFIGISLQNHRVLRYEGDTLTLLVHSVHRKIGGFIGISFQNNRVLRYEGDTITLPYPTGSFSAS